MPKILQINVSANWGSHGKIASQIGDVVMSHGWESYIAFGRDYNPCSSKLIKIGGRWNVYEHLLETRLFDNHGLASRYATKRLIPQIKQMSPDIIHLHNIHGYYLNYKILFEYLQSSDIPVIWTFHDCWPITGHCGYFSLEGCEKWRTGCSNCPLRWKEYPQSLIIDRSANNYQLKKQLFGSLKHLYIVSVSKWLDSIIGDSFLSHIRHSYIYNGIDIDIFKPTTSNFRENYGLQNKKVLLGVASIWTNRKALSDYVKLSQLLSEEYQIILIGPTEKQSKTIPDNIIVISRTNSQSELAQWYSAADILLNLSYEETFGLTTVESFACGTPSIVYNRTASPELITKNTGIVVEAGNWKALLCAIEEIVSKGKNYYTDACRQRAIDYFNKDDRFQDYINLYNELLNEKDITR